MSEELKDKMYQKLSLYSSELEDRIEDLEKLNTTITMENERLINEMKKLEKDNQTLMNSMVTEAHTKLQEELENLKNTNEEHRILNGKLREENKDLQQRIDKAINYIKCGIKGDLNDDRAYVDENALLDILQGSDKE